MTRDGLPDDARALLEARARHLARVSSAEDQPREEIEVVTFALSKERYAIESRYVLEVRQFADSTPVPGGPPHLLGLTNLRGSILPIFDLRELFGIPQRTISDLFRVIVLGDERAEFAFLADAVEEVTAIPADEVGEPPASQMSEFVGGVTKDALVLLDGRILMTSDRFYVEDQL